MKKYLIKDLKKGIVNISKEQLLEIPNPNFIPTPPVTGTALLKSVEGVMTWIIQEIEIK